MIRTAMMRLGVVLLLGLIPAVAEACPGCKDSLIDPGGLSARLATAHGYALSIGLLLAVPFVLVGALTMMVIRAQRTARRQTATSREG